MKFLVAIMVPSPWREQIKALQLAHRSPRWKISLEPHITILPPAESRLELDQANEMFAHAQISLAPFTIRSGGLGRFADGPVQVIYNQIEPLDKLLELRRQLSNPLKPLADFRLRQSYTPHLTLSNRLTPAEADAAARQLIQTPLDFEFSCHKLTLLHKTPGLNHWQPTAELALKS
jgi:2'-5' RNA ligase